MAVTRKQPPTSFPGRHPNKKARLLEGRSYKPTSAHHRYHLYLASAKCQSTQIPWFRPKNTYLRFLSPPAMTSGTLGISQDPGDCEIPSFAVTFKGNREKIKEKYESFWSLPQAGGDVLAYHEGKSGHQFTPEVTNADKWLQPNPRFTKENLNRTEILAEDDDATILRLFSSFSRHQYPAGSNRGSMSVVHLLVIPKARYFNGVSLNGQTVDIIDKMIALFKKNWAEKSFRDKIIEHQKILVISADPDGKNMETTNRALERLAQLKDEICELDADKDFLFGLHLYPEHSVGHLHMHVFAKGQEFRQDSYPGHDKKTMDAMEVRDYIMSLPESHPANQVKYPDIDPL
jgi:hypothetical protein